MSIKFRNINNNGKIIFRNSNGSGSVNFPAIFTPPPTPQALYTNIPTYIINGIRQATNTSTVRSNVTSTRRLIVTQTITFEKLTMIRIPPSNWSFLNMGDLRPTFIPITNTGATIDGLTNNKQFYNQSVIYNPDNSALRANNTSQFDIYTMRPTNLSLTTLTPGEYNLSVFSTSANFDLAVLVNNSFPIDTSRPIHPSPTASTTHFVMEIF